MPGMRVAQYEILDKLGAGGMGEVFRARDTRLERFVAIKMLPADKLGDPLRKQRFLQEARAPSALNHPNIVTIYEIPEQDGVLFLVMEYVQGKSLDVLIPRKGLSVNAALRYATSHPTLLVKHEKYPIHDGNLSPDGRWLAFKLVTSASIQPVYVTPVGGGTPAGEKDWIKISGDYNQTKPFWSPDGDLLYYFSTQDSFDCLYARRLDPATKRPLADAFAVRHFHEDLRPPNGSFTGYGLAADRLYLTLATARSNVWLAEPEKR